MKRCYSLLKILIFAFHREFEKFLARRIHHFHLISQVCRIKNSITTLCKLASVVSFFFLVENRTGHY